MSDKRRPTNNKEFRRLIDDVFEEDSTISDFEKDTLMRHINDEDKGQRRQAIAQLMENKKVITAGKKVAQYRKSKAFQDFLATQRRIK